MWYDKDILEIVTMYESGDGQKWTSERKKDWSERKRGRDEGYTISGHQNGRKSGVRERGGETRNGQKWTSQRKEDWSERKRGRDEEWTKVDIRTEGRLE